MTDSETFTASFLDPNENSGTAPFAVLVPIDGYLPERLVDPGCTL